MRFNVSLIELMTGERLREKEMYFNFGFALGQKRIVGKIRDTKHGHGNGWLDKVRGKRNLLYLLQVSIFTSIEFC